MYTEISLFLYFILGYLASDFLTLFLLQLVQATLLIAMDFHSAFTSLLVSCHCLLHLPSFFANE